MSNRNPKSFSDREMGMQTYLANARVKSVLEQARKFTKDPERKERQAAQKCKACYYVARVAGAAITTQPCACCAAVQTYGSTSTDALCKPCAEQHQLCKHCGGDIDMNLDRQTIHQESTPA